LLSNGSAHRLWQGNTPDLERLTPAILIERLSASWLHTGLGPPFLVLRLDDEAAAQQLLGMQRSEHEAFFVLCLCAADLCLVAYQPLVSVHVSTSREGQRQQKYQYNATCVIAGGEPWRATMGAFREIAVTHGHISVLHMPRTDWSRLVSGYMGNTEFFSKLSDAAQSDALRPVRSPDDLPNLLARTIAENSSHYVIERPRDIAEQLPQLSPEDQAAIIQLIESLHRRRK